MADAGRAILIWLFLFPILGLAQTPLAMHVVPPNRIASISVSEDFLNEQIAIHNRGAMFKDLKASLDPDNGNIFLRGKFQVPIEDLKAINIDPRLGLFHFQVTIRPQASKHGHLILEFPLNETYFYPADSKDRPSERIIVPVQMLSLALASVRGYLAALSGDYTGFETRAAKYTALIRDYDRSIAHEKNADALQALKDQRAAMRLKLESIPLERRQMQDLSKEFGQFLSFTGEKELNLNSEIGARKNALILKLKLSQIVPYLADVQLGGVRVRHDKKDGQGENYFVVDVNSKLASQPPPEKPLQRGPREGIKVAPSLIVRLNQALLESDSVVDAEKKQFGSKLRDFKLMLKEDGLHVSGKYHKFFFSIPFETTVDFITTAVDVFEVRVRELSVAGIDLDFLTSYVLDSMKARLDSVLKGMCTFESIGELKDHSRALRVSVDSGKLVPAFPDLHLVSVDVREREFLLKIGKK